MGAENSKLSFRNTVIRLTTRTQPVDATDDAFWNQFWDEYPTTTQDIFVLIPAAEIRALRAESPSNLATLCYKSVEKIATIAENTLLTNKEQQSVLNCIRLLTRIIPYIFEDPDWRTFFWSIPSSNNNASDSNADAIPLAQTLIAALCDLLFCPDFTISVKISNTNANDEIRTIDSCEHIWQAGVGFAQTQTSNSTHDANRAEILKLLLTCFSETMYLTQNEAHTQPNKWVQYFTSSENRHALPLFASLLNVLCAYDPVGLGIPYNHLVFTDPREPLVESAGQILCIVLEPNNARGKERNLSVESDEMSEDGNNKTVINDNLFVNYMSRIHRDEDFAFILAGVSRLLNNPLTQTYLPGSTKKVQMHQELLILFWRMCDVNKQFMYYVLKSAHVLDILVPVLYHLNDARSDQARLGLVHICVFILLLLSGERNFGVRLNKSYQNRVPMDLTVFSGTHADLLIIVFHKVITTGHQRLQPLFDCLMTIIVNISPYLKTLSMVSATKLVHLMEAFSQTWFLYAAPHNNQLVFFLLEVFNNIIQYQFDGNSNLIYSLIRKRHIFYHLANLPTDPEAIAKACGRKAKSHKPSTCQIETSTASSSSKISSTSSHQQQRPRPDGSPRKASTSSSTQQQSNVEDDANNLLLFPITDEEDQHNAPKEEENTDSNNNSDVIVPPGPVMHASLPEMPSVQAMTKSGQVLADVEAKPSGDLPLILSNSPERTNENTKHQQDKLEKSGSSNGHSGFSSINFSEEKLTSNELGAQLMKTSLTSSSDQSRQMTQQSNSSSGPSATRRRKTSSLASGPWSANGDWVMSWKSRLPLQTLIRLLQVLVPQVEQICINKNLTDESEIIRFLQNGTLVGLLPVPHPILIRKYQPNVGTFIWFRNYMWGVIYLRNVDPPIWYDTNVRLFEIQRI